MDKKIFLSTFAICIGHASNIPTTVNSLTKLEHTQWCFVAETFCRRHIVSEPRVLYFYHSVGAARSCYHVILYDAVPLAVSIFFRCGPKRRPSPTELYK